MPFFRYSVANKDGQLLTGTLQAPTREAAASTLVTAGYSVREVIEQAGQPAVSVPVPRPTPFAPTPPVAAYAPPVARPAPQARFEAPGSVHVKVPLSNPLHQAPVKTKRGKDRDLFFLFSQLGSYFRSGMNPAQSLTDLASRTPERYRDSLRRAAEVVAEGGRMSDALESYPYLYPPDVIGTIRAGEVAGFMPEAMDEIADKMEGSHRLKKKIFYYQLVFAATFGITPIILAIVDGSLDSIKLQDAAGGSLPPVATLAVAALKSMLAVLPLSALIFFIAWGICSWINSMKMRNFRHSVIMRIPVIGGRAAAESMARFTWALSMVSRGGLSPQNTFLLALESVPNLAIKQRLITEGRQMTEASKLSTTLRGAGVLPPEFGDIVQTGEITGDVPRALETVRRATDADFRAKDETTARRAGFIFLGLLAVVITILAGWLLTRYYSRLIPTVLGE